ncbi:MAG: BON domain-containing protein [Acidobacteriia bacterium]|nr:BON domain-containing protein [Terriglobia bacterium]
MSHLRAMLAIPLLTAACWAAGATEPAPKPAAAVTQRPSAKPSSQPAKTDAQIERDIRARLAKSKIGSEKFQVRVQGGVATFEGKTNVIQHKGAATRMAKSAGAVAVANHIEISEAAKEKAAQNLDSGRRRAQVKRGDPRSETATARQQSR